MNMVNDCWSSKTILEVRVVDAAAVQIFCTSMLTLVEQTLYNVYQPRLVRNVPLKDLKQSIEERCSLVVTSVFVNIKKMKKL